MVAKTLEPTSQKHTTHSEATRKRRERLAYLIAKSWRRAGRYQWTDAEMSAAIDQAIERSATASNESHQPPSCDGPPVQMGLFPAGHESAATRSTAAVEALKRSPTRQAKIEGFIVLRGQRGATRDEIAMELSMPIQSVCEPVLSLERSGRIVATTRHRLTRTGSKAVVLVAADFEAEAGQ
jgi:predicted Rossmann fold nucleotide-binding protein DprA/Smf involved in DNA uptake